jgi:hypothetical protein
MRSIRREITWICCRAMLAAGLAERPDRAEEGVVEKEPRPIAPRNSRLFTLAFVVATTTAGAARAQRDRAELPDESAIRAAQLLELDFQTERIDRQRGRTDRREQFESALRSRVDRLDRKYGLSEGQRKKLLLTGRVEIKRHLDRAEELERKLSLVRSDAEDYMKVLEEINTLDRTKSHDLFDEGTLFAKVLGNTLTKEQTLRYQAIEQRIAAERHQAALKWVLATWDEMLGLSAHQRERLQRLLSQSTRPPRRFGAEDYFGVLWQVSQLPEPVLKPIFREDQWAKLTPQLAEARRREPMLKREGYVPDRDVLVGPSPADAPATSEKKQG